MPSLPSTTIIATATNDAIMPYSMAVNVGAYAEAVRGATDMTTKNVTGATQENPVKISSTNHGFANGDKVMITGVNGMTQLNNNGYQNWNAYYVVADANSSEFTLRTPNGSTIDGTGFAAYINGGEIRCWLTKCAGGTGIGSERPGSASSFEGIDCGFVDQKAIPTS